MQDSLATFDLVRFSFTLQLKEHNKGTELGENVSTALAPCHYTIITLHAVSPEFHRLTGWIILAESLLHFVKGIFTMKLEEELKIAEIVFSFVCFYEISFIS